MRSLLVTVVLFCALACEKSGPDAPVRRATLNRTGGTTFQLVPSAGQHPHCLAYTVSRSGLTRQLTMSRGNQSFSCEAGVPLGGRSFKVPLNEGPVKVYVFFSSQPLSAASLSQQILDVSDRQALSVMQLRIPGKAALETLDFVPEADVAPDVGDLLVPDAGADLASPGDGGP